MEKNAIVLEQKCAATKIAQITTYSALLLFIVFFFVPALAQTDDNYKILGRVVDEYGNPCSDANVLVEPAKFMSKSFERFLESSETDSNGKFLISKNRKKISATDQYFLFAWVDNNLDSMTLISPPFDRVRKYDSKFNGRSIKFGKESEIAVGTIKVQFWFQRVSLDLSSLEKLKQQGRIKWGRVWIRLKNQSGIAIYDSNMSLDDINKYVNSETSQLRVSLPEGQWKIEILFDNEEKNMIGKKFGETKLFKVTRQGGPYNLVVIPANRNS